MGVVKLQVEIRMKPGMSGLRSVASPSPLFTCTNCLFQALGEDSGVSEYLTKKILYQTR